MTTIEVKGFSEDSYPRCLVLKAGRIGAINIISISEVEEKSFDFTAQVPEWALKNVLHSIRPETIYPDTLKVKIVTGGLIEEMEMPEWAVANVVISCLTTYQLDLMIKQQHKGEKMGKELAIRQIIFWAGVIVGMFLMHVMMTVK